MSQSLNNLTKITVLGAGSFGTSLAQVSSIHPNSYVQMFARDQKVVDSINNFNKNSKFMSNFNLNKNITATSSIKEALADSKFILGCIPTQLTMSVLSQNKSLLDPNVPFISCSKGMIISSKQFISQAFKQEFGEKHKFAVFSGPSFADEILKGHPTLVSIACENQETGISIQNQFSNEYLRLYTVKDVIGTEIAAAMKNVIAIGAGMIIGAGYGMNTLTGFIIRSSQEIQMFANIFGSDPQTFFGLAGMGDLMLTAFGKQSRNRTFGERFGKGEKLEDILKSSGGVVEGLSTLIVVKQFAKENNLSMPCTDIIYSILYENLNLEQAGKQLMLKSLSPEFPTFNRNQQQDYQKKTSLFQKFKDALKKK